MGRNAAELVAAAEATGTYAGYVGDGASVPWQVALPHALPLNVTMFVYKAYLDLHWPAAFKLHDWCYTPYGALIGVTRSEADDALFELIAVTSVIDAWIVWTAVRAGGGLYFGHSLTGYVGTQNPMPVPNMLSPPQNCR
jgi:hypothetical protein